MHAANVGLTKLNCSACYRFCLCVCTHTKNLNDPGIINSHVGALILEITQHFQLFYNRSLLYTCFTYMTI